MTQQTTRMKGPNHAVLVLFTLAVVVTLTSAGCRTGDGSSGPQAVPSGQTPAYQLASDDLGKAPDSGAVARYETTLDGLAAHCTEDKGSLAAEIIAGRQDLVKNGIKNETDLSLITHIESSIPSNLGLVDCRSFLAAYLVLVEPTT